MNEPAAVPLPMFPLGSVVFPHTAVPIHVFEPRYRVLVRHCLRGTGRFGTVLIERGSDVGGGDSRFGFGTVLRLAEASETEDGRWGIVAVGEERLRVVTWLPDDPYPVALVEILSETELDAPSPELLAEVAALARRTLAYKAELGEPAAAATFELSAEPQQAAFQLCALAPVGPLDQQQLLEATDHPRRLEHLRRLLEEEAAVLALRLAEG